MLQTLWFSEMTIILTYNLKVGEERELWLGVTMRMVRVSKVKCGMKVRLVMRGW